MKLIMVFFLAAAGALSCEAADPDRTIIPPSSSSFGTTVDKWFIST
jgi:hypothetical protein